MALNEVYRQCIIIIIIIIIIITHIIILIWYNTRDFTICWSQDI